MSRHTPWIPCESVRITPRPTTHRHIHFQRTGEENENGSIPGEMTIGNKTWPTMERGRNYTFARKGDYVLTMEMKVKNPRPAMRFSHEGVRLLMIHDANEDRHTALDGCIAPGLEATATGVTGSAKAMSEVFDALGGFNPGTEVTLHVENNIWGDETAREFVERRKKAGKW